MRPYGLTAGKAGITRLRTKGGASPETLHDLVNGHVTASRTIVPRPGTRVLHTIPETIGVCYFDGKFVVFADHYVESPDPEVVVEILVHPVAGSTATLQRIYFAQPFLGYLYVVAGWSDDPDTAYHYWLQSWGEWAPNTDYSIGATVQPTTPNGFAYVAERLNSPYPKWAARVVRTVGDKIEPTVANGFYFECIDTIGGNPASGATEPAWPAVEDATVIEETGGTPTTVGGDGDDNGGGGDDGQGGTTVLPPNIGDRYGNMSGRSRDGTSTQVP